MSLLRKLAGETAIYGFSYILSRVLYYVVFTAYLTRVISTTEFGIYRDLYFYVAILLIFLTFRMETTYFRFAREDRGAVNAMSMFFLAVFAGIFFLGLWWWDDDVARWLEYPDKTILIMMLGGVLFFDTLISVPFASLRQQNRPMRFLVLKLGSIVLNILFVLFFLEALPHIAGSDPSWPAIFRSDDKLFYVILSNLLASGITLLLLLPIMLRQPFRWDPGFLKKMLSYSWPLVIVGVAGVVNQYGSVPFLKQFLKGDTASNLSEGGIYAAAASLAILLSLFTTAFNYAAEPFFFAHKDKENARSVYADVALAFTIVGSLMMLMILGYIDLFQLLIGKDFRQGLSVVPVLLLAFLFLGIYYNVSAWYKLADKTIIGAWISILGMLVTIGLSIILIPRFGMIGSAWTALACYMVEVIVCYWIGQKIYPIPYKIWRMLGWISISLLCYGLMEVLRPLYAEHLMIILMVNSMIILIFIFTFFKLEKGLINLLRKSQA
jgi:O-antigen/teichoic acid export membrane protein